MIKKIPSHHRDLERAQLSVMAPIVLIIHGVRNAEQADELYRLIEMLKRGHEDPYKSKEYYKHIAIVVISSPELFRHLSYHNTAILTYTYTLYMSDSGAIIYSGNHYPSQRLEEDLRKRLVDGIHRMPGSESERLLSKCTQLGLLSAAQTEYGTSAAAPSTQSILKKLYELSEARLHILQGLSGIENIPHIQNDKTLLMDNVDKLNNVQTAEMLQQLFDFDSYREVIPKMDAKYASAAMNLTNTMLADGLPESGIITNQSAFNRRAERFRNWVARHLKQLPDELSISNIVQLSEFASKYGGFADVYRGRYKDPTNGVQIEVALKVLRIFGNPTEEDNASLGNFVKEALVWHGLKHKNILPFLGVDYITFTPRWAMVSPWISLGSVLDHMSKESAVIEVCDPAA
ncbi:Kinase-like protein [Mycena venus]|uniref:Kinase-like protein n=1 Tax=Mycena venus TaxID=2733690 RepID=A0A8H6WUI0_9AGAR|nr:Kinase-like protein [Mycena venus]